MTPPVAAAPVRSVKTLTENGGRLDWSSARNLIAFDRPDGRGIYQVYLMRPDGLDERCLTCAKQGLPPGHKGNPAWHPSGSYIVFQVEKAQQRPGSALAAPGRGLNTDIWVMDADGTSFFQLTDVPAGMGVLHPHFSPDGGRLAWAERVAAGRRGDAANIGEWAIRLADFVIGDGRPRLTNVRTFQPTGAVFYETHSFSPDGTTLLYSAPSEPGRSLGSLDIYALDLRTQAVRRLTASPNEWDEHAHYSPDGRLIIWMSSRDCGCDPNRPADLRTDFWLMAADGSNQVRLTYFNQRGHAHFAGRKVVAADSTWSPDGTRIAGYLITGADQGKIVLLELDPAALG